MELFGMFNKIGISSILGVKGRICCYGSLMVVVGFIVLSLSFLQMSDKCSLQRFKNSYAMPFAQVVDSFNDSRPQQQIPLMEETFNTTKFNSSAIGDDSIGMLQQCCFSCQCFFQYPRKLRSIIWFTCDAHIIYIVVQILYNQNMFSIMTI
jgi:hypothetical protein